MRFLLLLLMALAINAQNNQSSPMNVRPTGAMTLPGTIHIWDTSNSASVDITSSAIGASTDGAPNIGTPAKRAGVIEALQVVVRAAASGNQRCELTEEINCRDAGNALHFRVRPDSSGTVIMGAAAGQRVELIAGITNAYSSSNSNYFHLDPTNQDALYVSAPGGGGLSSTAIRGASNASNGFGGRFENTSSTGGSTGVQITSSAGSALLLSSASTYPDIAFSLGSQAGIFLNRAGAPTGTRVNSSLWLRNNGAAGSSGYYCISTAWAAIF